MLKKILFNIVLWGGMVWCTAQTIPERGIPLIEKFTPAEYGNQGKIWDIQLSENGLLYAVCDRGLLEYDGKTWNSFKGSKGNTRSLWVENDSVIYTGSDFDFGIWKKNQYRSFEYTSLYPFKEKANEENEEFWNVYKIKDQVIFVSFDNVYVYQNNQFTKIAAPYRFNGCFLGNDQTIYLSDEKEGVFTFDGKSIDPLFHYPDHEDFRLIGVQKKEDELLIITRDQGLFKYTKDRLTKYETEVSPYLKNNSVFSFTSIGDQYYAFGTIFSGLYITDKEGKVLQHIDKQRGLLHNTILSLYYESSKSLWISMDYGLASLDLNSQNSYFFDYKGTFGTGATSLLKDDVFYLGTNQGLYKIPWQSMQNGLHDVSFELIPNSVGQVWDLENIKGTIFCGHDHGLFILQNNTLKQIHDEPGVWTLKLFRDEYLLSGNYNGVSVFKQENGAWSFIQKLDLIYGSCNQVIIEDENTIWVNIPNYGIIKVLLDKDFSIKQRTIFATDTFQGESLYLFKDRKGIHVRTETKVYHFDVTQKQFVETESDSVALNTRELIPEMNPSIMVDSTYRFYPIHNGFVLKNTKRKVEEKPHYSLILKKFETFNNEEVKSALPQDEISHKLNNARFEFIIPQQDIVLYQYKLEGYTDQWSDWSTNSNLDFLNLSEGHYILKVKGKVNDTIIESEPITFTISPPWYRKWYTYLLYGLLFLLGFYFLKQYENVKLKHQKKELLKKEQNSLREQAEKYRQEVLLQKQKQLEEDRVLLKNQLRDKAVELAIKSKDNKDKNRLLYTLKEKLNDIEKKPSLSKMRLIEMRRLVDNYLETEDQTFEIQMDEVHQEFYKKLKQKYPTLSLYDLRLASYLKIGLNSKEISEILHVLPSSINVSRSRLRKKFNLKAQDDLYEFLNSFD